MAQCHQAISCQLDEIGWQLDETQVFIIGIEYISFHIARTLVSI